MEQDSHPASRKGVSSMKGKARLAIYIARQLRVLAEKQERSFLSLALSFVVCKLWHGARFAYFRNFRLYECSGAGCRKYVFGRQKNRLQKRYFCPGVQEPDYLLFWEKHQFNETFREFIRREWLYAPDSTPEEIGAFLARHEVFIMKQPVGNMGTGVKLCHREELEQDSFISWCIEGKILLESYIHQHPDMAALNPSSVNTVRILTVRYKGKALAAGAGLRCGRTESYLDNFHAGGTAYPLDIETGIITGPGRDINGNAYLRHPTSGHIMPGFQVPHWQELLDMVCKAALISPRVGWVGWDVAVLPDGVELIEGNHSPGLTVIQLDGGIRKRLMDFIHSC